MKSPDLDALQVGLVGMFKLHGEVGLQTHHVGLAHLALQIHQQPGIGPLKFDQPRREPERAKPLGDGDPHLATERRRRLVQGAVEAERSLFHALGRFQNLQTFPRQPDAVDMTGHQRRLVGALQERDALAQEVRGHVQLFGGGAKAADPGHFQEYANQVPVRHSPRGVRTEVRTPALR